MDRGAGSGAGRILLNGLAALVLALMLAVAAQVALAFFDVNPGARFAGDWPLVGRAVTLNSLLDLQWHLFAMVALLPAGLVLLHGRHVRVDFLLARMRPGARRWVDLAGHAVFAAPFFVMALPAAWDFARRAWVSGEGSRNDGLNDLWLVKGVLPLGLALLAGAILWEAVRLVRRGGEDG